MTGVRARVEGYLEEGVKNQGMEGSTWGITAGSRNIYCVSHSREQEQTRPRPGGPAVRGERLR